MDFSRRELAGLIAATVVIPVAEAAPQTSESDDDKAARELLRNNIEQLGKVKLPMETEPASHFRA
jgi:hypothetical protein